jgi:putative RecB family exonuclease
MVEHRSASQLTVYAECSEAYRLKYVEKVPQYPAAWLAQGNAFHETVEEWELAQQPPFADLHGRYVQIYDQGIAAFDGVEPNRQHWLRAPKSSVENDISNRRELGLLLLRNYSEFVLDEQRRPLLWVDDYTPGIELPFSVTFGDVEVRGKVDRVEREEDGSLHIIDLKTGNRESAKIQLGIYKVALEKDLGIKVSKASFFYAKDGKLVTLTDWDLARYTEDYVTDLVAALTRGIENKVFIPNVTQSCFLCPVKRECREFK